MSCFQERKRNLDDEKKIREKEVEAKNLQQVITKLQENAAVFNIDTLVDEKSNLNETAVRMQHRVSIGKCSCTYLKIYVNI